jgi:hypothetical protein
MSDCKKRQIEILQLAPPRVGKRIGAGMLWYMLLFGDDVVNRDSDNRVESFSAGYVVCALNHVTTPHLIPHRPLQPEVLLAPGTWVKMHTLKRPLSDVSEL